jgi:hypothetical protein
MISCDVHTTPEARRTTMNPQTLHVLPIGDLVQHEEVGDECVCGPHVEFYPRGKVVVHHALDGRHSGNGSWAREKAREIAETRQLEDQPG